MSNNLNCKVIGSFSWNMENKTKYLVLCIKLKLYKT